MGKGGHGGHGGHGGGFHRGGHGGGFHHHHHRHHGPGIGIVGAAALGGMMYSRRMHRGRRGYGRRVVVVSAPPPEPAVLSATQITHFAQEGDHTAYFIRVFSAAGQQWDVSARYSAFEALSRNLEYANIRVPFPSKKPIRSLFGLNDGALEERRRDFEQWLAAAVAVSAVQPWVRPHLHAFLRVPAAARCAPVAAATTPTSGAAPPASNQIQVQMPPGVAPGEVLEIEVHGCVYNIPAPGDVAPGATFTVELPEDDPPQVATPYVPPYAPPAQAPATSAMAPPPAPPASFGGFAPPAQASPPAPAGAGALHVVVPAGVQPGQTLTVQAPSGQQLSIVVPPGVRPGQTLTVQAPPAAVVVAEAEYAPVAAASDKSAANPF